jgi:hypothetical protein
MDPQMFPPTGCTVGPTGVDISTANQLNCTLSSFAGVIQHYNFGPVNGHTCTGLNIGNAGGRSSLLIDDIYYLDDSGWCATSTLNSNEWMITIATWPGGVTLSNSTLDFNNNNGYDTFNGPCSVATGIKCNGIIWFLGNNPTTLKYNAFLHNPTDMYGSARNSATVVNGTQWEYNFIDGWQSRAPNGHKELIANGNPINPITGANNTIGFFIFDHNTSVNDAEATTDNGPTYLYMANGAGISYGTGPQITNNTIINAHVGGRPVPGGTTYTACIGASYSGGCVLGTTNNILFVTSENAPIGYGAAFLCGSAGIATYKTIPGPYPPGVVEELGIDGGLSGNYYPGWNATSTPQSCSGTIHAQEISDTVIMTGHGQSYAAPVMTGNYVDIDSFANGSLSPSVWDFFGTDTKPNPEPIASGSISGNTLTTSVNMNIEIGLYLYASNFSAQIPGCTITNLKGCPRILNGGVGTNTFALTATFGTPISAEPMSAYNVNWCGTPAVLSGNRSITGPGSVPDSWLNQLSSNQANSGC